MPRGQIYQDIRREVYDEDIGQAGWLLASELKQFVSWLSPIQGSRIIDIGCGAPTVHLARLSRCTVVGLCIDAQAITAAQREVNAQDLSDYASFVEHDANETLPFADESFDGAVCIDLIDHLANRYERLRDWARILKPGGRVIFTDPIVVTGALSDGEVIARASGSFTLFVPDGYTEEALESANFELEHREDLTLNMAGVAKRQFAARELHATELRDFEGERFDKLQEIFRAISDMASEKRLSRFAYLARKRGTQISDG